MFLKKTLFAIILVRCFATEDRIQNVGLFSSKFLINFKIELNLNKLKRTICKKYWLFLLLGFEKSLKIENSSKKKTKTKKGKKLLKNLKTVHGANKNRLNKLYKKIIDILNICRAT